MAKALGITSTGGPEVLAIVDREVREPAAGEVRIDVRAASISPTDLALRAGAYGERAGRYPFPWTPGMDAAGVVAQVGADVEGIEVGELVMAVVNPMRPEGGAQQERLVVPAESVVQIPGGASLEEASTLPMNGLTAILGLRKLDLAPGSSLLVTGGAGQLGAYVIALAKELGLRVLADAAEKDRDQVERDGADVVLERGDDLADRVREVEPDGVAGVFDTALLHEAVLPAIGDGGGLAVVRGWDGETDRGIVTHAVWVASVLQETESLQHLAEAASEGRIALRVADTYAPEDAAAAHERMEAGGVRGRLVLTF